MDKLVYDGFYKVYETEVEVKGKKRIYEKLDIKSAVAGIIIDEEGKIAIVSQYRPVVDMYTKEIPAGMIDKDLTNREILVEELFEECGVEKSEILYLSAEPVIKYFMIMGSSDCIMEIYEGKVKKQHSKKVDDCDVDAVEWLTIDELGYLVEQGEIYDSKTLMAYYYLKSKIMNHTKI